VYDPCTFSPLFFLSRFFLTGEIPVSLGNCVNMTRLILEDNKLTGKCMIHHTKLLQISIILFFLIGQIPKSLGNCIKLEVLNLYSNKLQGKCSTRHTKLLQISIILFFLIGPIPESLGNCIKLKFLDLSSNKLEGKCSIHHTKLLHFSLQKQIGRCLSYPFTFEPRIFDKSLFFDRKNSRFTWKMYQTDATPAPPKST
jgi:hypothetical protein